MSRRVAIALNIDEPYPHHQDILSGIGRYAKERGNWVCVIDEHPVYGARRRMEPAQQYDGVIARAQPHLQKRLQRLGIPLVNTVYQTSRPELPGVYSDPWALGRLAAEHLIDRAFRRLHVLVDNRHRHALVIAQEFVRRATASRISCAMHDLPEEPYSDPVYWLRIEKILTKVLKSLEPPVAIFIETAPVARLMIQLAQANTWRVPHEMAILCMHDLKAVVSTPPQISSLESNYEQQGYEAAKMLDRLMSGAKLQSKQVYIPPRRIIARESTDYFAVDDEVVAAALHYISGQLAKPLRLNDIASAAMVSPRLLQMRFSQALGRSVSDEIRRLRIEAAKRMLIEPGRQIREVAMLCGFRNSDIMGQVFRRELGMPPRQYRKQLR